MKTLKLIGKGSFSTVYQLTPKKVLIKSVCYSKECLALFITGSMFPKIEKIDYNEYHCEFYPKVKSLKNSLLPSEYEIYKELKNLYSSKLFSDLKNNYQNLYSEFKKLKSKKASTQLIGALDELINYGSDVKFEISPRNVAVKNGKLILLDVFFFKSQLMQTYKN
jgi:hypothetical protein